MRILHRPTFNPVHVCLGNRKEVSVAGAERQKGTEGRDAVRQEPG